MIGWVEQKMAEIPKWRITSTSRVEKQIGKI